MQNGTIPRGYSIHYFSCRVKPFQKQQSFLQLFCRTLSPILKKEIKGKLSALGEPQAFCLFPAPYLPHFCHSHRSVKGKNSSCFGSFYMVR